MSNEKTNDALSPEAAQLVEDRIAEIVEETPNVHDCLFRIVSENMKLKSDLVRMRNALERCYDLIDKITGSPEFSQFIPQPTQQQQT